MPSGRRLPSLTMTLRSEPSGLAENTSPLLALRKNKRAVAAFPVVFLTSDLEDLTAMISSLLYLTLQFWQDRLNSKLQFISIRQAKALRPVMALPRIRFCIWKVPS